MDEAMLEAHVRFELARWHGEGLRQTLAEEVDAALAWSERVTLTEVVAADVVTAVALRRLGDPEATEPLRDLVAAALVAGRDVAADSDDLTVGDVVPRETYDAGVDIAVGLEGVRDEALDQLTSSTVYSELLAHVLYQGVKRYVLQENVVARRVPGASSLLRLGQNAVSSVAPSLEKNVDRQLTAFVNANIQDTIRDSRSYLESALDAEVIGSVSDELWDSNAGTSLARLAGLVGDEDAEALAAVAADGVVALAQGELGARVVETAVARLYDEYGERPLAELLAAAGVEGATLVDDLYELAAPAAATALGSGYLEDRVRARLAPFYAQYATGSARRAARRPHRRVDEEAD